MDRLEGFQAGPYASRYNALAYTSLEGALIWLQERTRERERRVVEGTSHEMKHIPVESTNIVSVGYDPATHDLEVAFHSGNTYVYENVSVETYDEFMGSDSLGAYLSRVIKPMHLSHLKVEEKKEEPPGDVETVKVGDDDIAANGLTWREIAKAAHNAYVYSVAFPVDMHQEIWEDMSCAVQSAWISAARQVAFCMK